MSFKQFAVALTASTVLLAGCAKRADTDAPTASASAATSELNVTPPSIEGKSVKYTNADTNEVVESVYEKVSWGGGTFFDRKNVLNCDFGTLTTHNDKGITTIVIPEGPARKAAADKCTNNGLTAKFAPQP